MPIKSSQSKRRTTSPKVSAKMKKAGAAVLASATETTAEELVTLIFKEMTKAA